MRWFKGGIAEAVTLSKQNGSIFVVYVEGRDDQSAKLSHIIDTELVSQKLENDNFVAIKIQANSLPHQQFAEIYQQATAPSIHFIGKSGAPLEIIEEIKDSHELLQKIDSILQRSDSAVLVSNSVQPVSDFIKNEQKTDAVSENNTCTIKLKDESGEPQASTSDNNMKPVDNSQKEDVNVEVNVEVCEKEKVDKAKGLIDKRREIKKQEEEEKEKTKEIERRKMGQDVQKLKRWQHDQELKNIMEEREKEKKEQQAARQRILAQIEQDKADRAAKFSTSSLPAQQSPPITSQPVHKTSVNSNIARLQFKLPDGSSHTQEFSNSSNLSEVRIYITTNLNLSFNNFTLATAFPKREFSVEDDSKTLQELELVPSAVILILPIPHGTVGTNPSIFTTFLWSIIAPILNILGYFKNMIFGGPKPPTQPSTQENKRSADTTGESSKSLPKRRAGETTVIRRQGNVHRLTDKADSDDENNTWNGNSTQQM